jgi:hypothetical protein
MQNSRIVLGLALIALCLPCFGQKSAKPQKPAAPAAGTELFLTDDDVAHVKRVLPGLADASQLGPEEANAHLAKLDIPFDRVTQVLTNISVAYSAIKFEEWMQELKPTLDMSKPSAYKDLVDAGQHQLDQLTEKYKNAKQGGKTALEANMEVVRKNRTDVEALLVRMQGIKTSSMPFHP